MERRSLHQRADPPQHPAGTGRHRGAQQRDLARRRRDQAQEHADCGGLARAVRAQEAVDRTAWNLEVDAIDSSLASKPLGEPAGDNRRRVGWGRTHLLSA